MDGRLGIWFGLPMFAVGGGGPAPTLPGNGFAPFGLACGLLSFSFFGFGGAPPYFSSNSCVESYRVAALSLVIVAARVAC